MKKNAPIFFEELIGAYFFQKQQDFLTVGVSIQKHDLEKLEELG